jgi:hypothetical protein
MMNQGDDLDQDTPPHLTCRANYTESLIVVYHICDTEIAKAALESQTLDVPAFKPDLHTWIKPSFALTLKQYRGQHENHRQVLAMHITRKGWEQAISWDHSRLSGKTPYVRYRHDSEVGIEGESLPWRTIQVSLSSSAVTKGLFSGWIVKVNDVTDVIRTIGELVDAGKLEDARALLPIETPYRFLGENKPETSG